MRLGRWSQTRFNTRTWAPLQLLFTVIVALQLTTTSWMSLFWWPDVLDSYMAGDARAPWTVLLLLDWVAMLIVANLLVPRSVAREQFFDKSDGSYVGRSLLCDASSCIPARYDLPLRLAIINGLAFPTPYLGLSLFLLLEARSSPMCPWRSNRSLGCGVLAQGARGRIAPASRCAVDLPIKTHLVGPCSCDIGHRRVRV